MKRRRHNLFDAIRQIELKGCKIKKIKIADPITKPVILIPRRVNIGIKTWGHIHYLCDQHGYEYLFN